MNMTQKIFRPILISGLLFSLILTTACTSKNDAQENHVSESEHEVMDQLKTRPIQNFPNTANDAHDIAVLEKYQQTFTENNNALEADLKKRSVDGNLTAEIGHQLKRDGIESALNMLKELDLKQNKDAIFKVCIINTGKIKPKFMMRKNSLPMPSLKILLMQ